MFALMCFGRMTLPKGLLSFLDYYIRHIYFFYPGETILVYLSKPQTMPSSENLEQQFPDLVSVFQLDNLTGDQIQALLKIGIRTVADLAGADLFLNPVLKEDNMHAQIKQIIGE